MANRTMNEEYEKLVKQMQLLVDWRNSTKCKRKARSIQKVIEKKLPKVIPTYSYRRLGDIFNTHVNMSRERFMYIYGLREVDWRADFFICSTQKDRHVTK